MRFKTKFVFTDPEAGTTRLKRVFAWLPIIISGEKIWLEYYEELQGFIVLDYKVLIDGSAKGISVSDWVTLSKRIIN